MIASIPAAGSLLLSGCKDSLPPSYGSLFDLSNSLTFASHRFLLRNQPLVREFSRGMRQRLAVGRAFLHQPDILLLDEPFTALDDRAIAVLQKLLRDGHEQGRTIILSTHQLREALEVATHVALIQRGQLAFSGERTQQMVDDTGWLYRTHGEN